MPARPTPSLHFATLQAGQEEALWQLFQASVHQLCAQDYSPAQLAAWAPAQYDAPRWEARMQQLQPLLAWHGEQAAAYADLQADGLIDHFFGHPQHRGLGIAGQLMEQLLARGRQQSIGRAYAAVSLTAQPFFARHGFRIRKRQRVLLGDQYLENAIMERDL